jgi:hypothetical protein
MQARAEEKEKEKEPLAIVEIGGLGSWTLSGDSSFGPTVGVEFEPIKNWLEIEVSAGPMFGNWAATEQCDRWFDKSRRRVRARFHVLAVSGSKIRMVLRAELQLHVYRRAVESPHICRRCDTTRDGTASRMTRTNVVATERVLTELQNRGLQVRVLPLLPHLKIDFEIVWFLALRPSPPL